MKYCTALVVLLISLSVNWLCDAKSIVIRHQKLNQKDATQVDNKQLNEIKSFQNNLLFQSIIEDIYEQKLDELLPEILEYRRQNGLQTSLLVN